MRCDLVFGDSGALSAATLLNLAIKFCCTPSTGSQIRLDSRGDFLVPLLSYNLARRACTGVRPIEPSRIGVRLGEGVSSISFQPVVGMSTKLLDSSCSSVCFSNLSPASELKMVLIVFELGYQYRLITLSDLKELSSIDTITTPDNMNWASNLLTHTRFSSKLTSLYLMLAAFATLNRSWNSSFSRRRTVAVLGDRLNAPRFCKFAVRLATVM